MGKKTGDGYKKGATTGRSQFYNPATDTWYVRDTATGQILYSKRGEPYKGVRKE